MVWTPPGSDATSLLHQLTAITPTGRDRDGCYDSGIVKLGASTSFFHAIRCSGSTTLASMKPLELQHQGPLRFRGLHCVGIEDHGVGRRDDRVRIVRKLAEPLLKSRGAIEGVTRETGTGLECLICHGLDDLLNWEYPGGVARLLLRRTVHETCRLKTIVIARASVHPPAA